ncbi:hypothetical protein R9C00_14170 [Flammeovirgaceae bacterium SG7u.111]|nr:hypothetical protein [Flammeovirgaceae bacterium SG7u.132]WPO38602.1 hypothetical protein R9C00_14170 [Flammeovirgaceae bacterium SG7u.111]
MKLLLTSLFIFTLSFSTYAHSVENKDLLTYLFAEEIGGQLSKERFLRSDSLFLLDTKRNDKIIVQKGMTLDVFTKENIKVTGELTQISADSIELKTAAKNIYVALVDITKITVYFQSNPVKGMFQGLSGLIGFTSVGLGGASLIGGAAALSSSVVLGVGLIAVSAPLIYFGIKQLHNLSNSYQRTVKLNKRWKVAVSEGSY